MRECSHPIISQQSRRKCKTDTERGTGCRSGGGTCNRFICDRWAQYLLVYLDRICKTPFLYILGKAFGGLDVEGSEIALKFKGVSPSQIQDIYHSLLENCPSAEEIAAKIQNISNEKYDRYLSRNLAVAEFAKKYIDTHLSPF